MPTLDAQQLRLLNELPVHVCGTCGRAVRPNYCRQCDVFFAAGHMSAECAGGELHDSHRTY